MTKSLNRKFGKAKIGFILPLDKIFIYEKNKGFAEQTNCKLSEAKI